MILRSARHDTVTAPSPPRSARAGLPRTIGSAASRYRLVAIWKRPVRSSESTSAASTSCTGVATENAYVRPVPAPRKLALTRGTCRRRTGVSPPIGDSRAAGGWGGRGSPEYRPPLSTTAHGRNRRTPAPRQRHHHAVGVAPRGELAPLRDEPFEEARSARKGKAVERHIAATAGDNEPERHRDPHAHTGAAVEQITHRPGACACAGAGRRLRPGHPRTRGGGPPARWLEQRA